MHTGSNPIKGEKERIAKYFFDEFLQFVIDTPGREIPTFNEMKEICNKAADKIFSSRPSDTIEGDKGLAVLFDEWKLKNGVENGFDGCWHIPRECKPDDKVGVSDVITPEKLYQYWLKNIHSPKQ